MFVVVAMIIVLGSFILGIGIANVGSTIHSIDSIGFMITFGIMVTAVGILLAIASIVFEATNGVVENILKKPQPPTQL